LIKQIGLVIEASSIDNANYKVTEALQNVNTDRSSCLSFSSLFLFIQFLCPARTIGVSAKINKCASSSDLFTFQAVGYRLISGSFQVGFDHLELMKDS